MGTVMRSLWLKSRFTSDEVQKVICVVESDICVVKKVFRVVKKVKGVDSDHWTGSSIQL